MARALQRRYGNTAVERMANQTRQQAAPIVQAKLVVTWPGDRYEQEADSAAAQLSHAAPDSVQRAALSPVSAGLAADAGMPVTPAVEAGIQAARGGGQALPVGVRSQMEGALGADFGGVRVHTGLAAHALNVALQARAFTTGRDIFFRHGEYAPGGAGGRQVLAHELAHVVQQGGEMAGTAPVVQRWPFTITVDGKNEEFKDEADAKRKLSDLQRRRGGEYLQKMLAAIEALRFDEPGTEEALNARVVYAVASGLLAASQQSADPMHAPDPSAVSTIAPSPASHGLPLSAMARQTGQAREVTNVKKKSWIPSLDELKPSSLNTVNRTVEQVHREELWNFIMRIKYLILGGDYDGAYRHCISQQNAQLLGCDLHLASVTEGKPDEILYRVSSGSKYTANSNKIKLAMLPHGRTPSSVPGMARKIVLVYLEEYMHLYQCLTTHFFSGKTGQFMKAMQWKRKDPVNDLDEVDILAAFHDWGFIDRDDEFVERYPERQRFWKWLHSRRPPS
jgi:hypothetical protein